LLDESIGCDESVVLAGKLLDQLLVLVELLQVIRGHSINSAVFGTIDIVLVTENAITLSACALSSCIRVVKRTRCSCQDEGRLGDGRFQRNACHVEDHSS
jgi:hypothetical protein